MGQNSCVKAWFGRDTFGRGIEVAQRGDGKFFCRFYEYKNGFGKGWSKWHSHDEPSFETHGVNRYSGERTTYKEPVLFWGFQPMQEIKGVLHYRLPKVAN
jgi:hypothetical protein